MSLPDTGGSHIGPQYFTTVQVNLTEVEAKALNRWAEPETLTKLHQSVLGDSTMEINPESVNLLHVRVTLCMCVHITLNTPVVVEVE